VECGTCPDETNVKKPINIRQGGCGEGKKAVKYRNPEREGG
jgi:hypothetical protein